MTLDTQQLKQIVQYNADRMYFGNWTPNDLSSCFKEAKTNNIATLITVGKLTNDVICDTLWNEMSLNPKRFGYWSPFKTDDKNNLIYFKNTYKNKILYENFGKSSKNVMNLIWKIKNFVQNLYEAKPDTDFISDSDDIKLYDYFVKTGELPTTFRIFDKNYSYERADANAGYRILGSLCGALHLITNQNWKDLQDPEYKEQITLIVEERFPNGTRPNLHYTAEKITQQPNQTKPVTENKPAKEPTKQIVLDKTHTPVIQMCLPFVADDSLTQIDIKIQNIDAKIDEIKEKIRVLEYKLDAADEMYDIKNFVLLQKKLDHAKHQFASYCGTKQKLLNKQCDILRQNDLNR